MTIIYSFDWWLLWMLEILLFYSKFIFLIKLFVYRTIQPDNQKVTGMYVNMKDEELEQKSNLKNRKHRKEIS